MDIRKYQENAKRTMRIDEDNRLNISHCLTGMFSEISELFLALSKNDPINIREEIGDMFFYFSNLCTFKEIELYSFKSIFELENKEEVPTDFVVLDVIDKLSKLSDFYKREVFYEVKSERSVEISHLRSFATTLSLLCISLDIDYSTVMGKNIDKLQKRYPEKFTIENAVNRDLNAELKSLS